MDRKDLLKKYLNRYNAANRRIAEISSTHDIILQNSNSPQYGSGYKTFPRVQGGGVSQGAASFSLRLSEIEDRLSSEKEQLNRLIIDILDILDYLEPTSDARSILEMKYIQSKNDNYIYKALYISRTKYFECLSSALTLLLTFDRINTILDEYEEELQNYGT